MTPDTILIILGHSNRENGKVVANNNQAGESLRQTLAIHKPLAVGLMSCWITQTTDVMKKDFRDRQMAPVNWINDFPFKYNDGNTTKEAQYCGYYPLLTFNISGGTIQESIDQYGQHEAPAGYHPKSFQEIIASQALAANSVRLKFNMQKVTLIIWDARKGKIYSQKTIDGRSVRDYELMIQPL